MVKKYLIICFSLLSSLTAAPLPFELDLNQTYPENIVINNRILLKINGKVITVMDVVRKMDLLFYREYPEMATSSMARYQFYASAWRSILGAVIDDYLIMADAEEKEVTVNDGEVREELEKMFGPDVVLNLDKLGMSLQEAFDLLKTELVVQRMNQFMVRAKAVTEVNPLSIKQKYQQFIKSHPPRNYWVYKMLSIRGVDHEKIAQEAFRLLTEEKIPFEELSAHLEHEAGAEISYSNEHRQHADELSLNFRSVLEKLSIGMTSAPVTNKSVSRLLCLKGIENEQPPSFREAEEDLKHELMQQAMAHHGLEYKKKLRKNYGLTDKYLNQLIPENLQPFALR